LQQEIQLEKRDDDFSERNAMQAVPLEDGKVLLFGGQDSQEEKQYNQLYLYDAAEKALTRIHFMENKVIPPKRNSHTFTRMMHAPKAYLACGANSDGPLKDIYEVDLQTLDFKKMVLDESEMLLPATEMHSAHIYKEEELLLVGGRALEAGKKIEEI